MVTKVSTASTPSLSEQEFAEFLRLMDPKVPSLWKLEIDSDGKKVYSNLKPGETIVMVRCDTVVEGIELDLLVELITNPVERKKWDTNVVKAEVLETYSPVLELYLCELYAPFPMSNRELLQLRYRISSEKHKEFAEQTKLWQTEAKYWMIVTKSVEDPKYPPNESKIVRAETKLGGIILMQDKENPKKVHMSSLIFNDVKASLPDSVMNKFIISGTTRFYDNLLAYYKKTYPSPEDQKKQEKSIWGKFF